MAYTSGDLILDDHYNTFVTGSANGTPNHTVANVNSLWGTGSKVDGKGYGQTGTLPSVSVGATVTATQWANLLNLINTIGAHQGTSLTAITNPIGGDLITAYTALDTNISNITTNRYNAVASGTIASHITSRTTQWNQSVTMTQTVTFSSIAAMQYFFYAGGMIGVSFSRSGGTTPSDKNDAWTALCTACGEIVITSAGNIKTIAGTTYDGTNKLGGSGTINTIATGTGYNELTSVDTVVFRQYDSSIYSSNYIEISANVNNNVFTIKTSYFDAANIGGTDEFVDGTLSTTLNITSPDTTYLTDTWGTPTLGGTETGS